MNSWACAARAAASISALRCVRRAVRDVAGDRVVEENGVLRDHADLRPQRAQRDVPDVDAVDQDGAARDVEEARHEVDERRLACPAQPHNRDRLTRANGE